MKKHIALFLALALLLPALASCDMFDSHEHEYKSYLIKAPTCTQKGSIERLCQGCGEKHYEDLEMKGHTFSDGVCLVCGVAGSDEDAIVPVQMPAGANNQASWSMSKLHETASEFGFNGSYASFVSSLDEASISEPYIDALGLVHLSVTAQTTDIGSLDVPLALVVGKVSPTSGSELPVIQGIEIVNSSLLILYANGTQAAGGRFTSSSGKPYLTGFGINSVNELVAYYSDGRIAFLGKVATGSAPANQSNITYLKEGGSYVVYRVSADDTVFTVPVSHEGRAIVRIKQGAFQNIGDNVRSIVIPEGITFEHGALSDLPAGVKVFLGGERWDYPTSLGTNATVYFKGDWTYVDGIPTVK